jgi:hypothetical protein
LQDARPYGPKALRMTAMLLEISAGEDARRSAGETPAL